MSRRYYEIAKKNYPEQWNRAMLEHLLELGRLTQAEFEDLVQEDQGEEGSSD